MSNLVYVQILAWHLVCFLAGYLSTLKEGIYYPEKGLPTLGTSRKGEKPWLYLDIDNSNSYDSENNHLILTIQVVIVTS